MTRSFRPEPLPEGSLDRVLDAGRRAPSAGYSQGTAFLVLESPEARRRYWDVTFPPERRLDYPWPGLFDAAALIVVLADEEAYLARYRESDKAASGLGESVDAWPVPYWLTDAAMAAENLLLAATDEGLGALFFGIFSGEAEVLEAFGVPERLGAVGVVALGLPAGDRPSRSLARGRKPLDEVVHRDRW